MGKIDLKLEAEKITVSPNSYYNFEVELENIEIESILKQIDIKDIISHSNSYEILDMIDVDDIRDFLEK